MEKYSEGVLASVEAKYTHETRPSEIEVLQEKLTLMADVYDIAMSMVSNLLEENLKNDSLSFKEMLDKLRNETTN